MSNSYRYFTRKRGDHFLRCSAVSAGLLGLSVVCAPLFAPIWLFHAGLSAIDVTMDDLPPIED